MSCCSTGIRVTCSSSFSLSAASHSCSSYYVLAHITREAALTASISSTSELSLAILWYMTRAVILLLYHIYTATKQSTTAM